MVLKTAQERTGIRAIFRNVRCAIKDGQEALQFTLFSSLWMAVQRRKVLTLFTSRTCSSAVPAYLWEPGEGTALSPSPGIEPPQCWALRRQGSCSVSLVSTDLTGFVEMRHVLGLSWDLCAVRCFGYMTSLLHFLSRATASCGSASMQQVTLGTQDRCREGA